MTLRENIIEKYATHMFIKIHTLNSLNLSAFDGEIYSYIRYNYFKNRKDFINQNEDKDEGEEFNVDDMLTNDEILYIICFTINVFCKDENFCKFYKTVIDGFYNWDIITRPDYSKIQNWVCNRITKNGSISVDNKTEMTNFVRNYKCSWWQ